MDTNNKTDAAEVLRCEDLLGSRMQTALVFAARYTHNRATGGTFAVVCALESCWHQLTKQTQEQILREAARDATTNKEDWERLRLFAANIQSSATPNHGL